MQLIPVKHRYLLMHPIKLGIDIREIDIIEIDIREEQIYEN